MNYPKISQAISDQVNDNIKKLEALFPSAVKDGELDIEALREELGYFNDVGLEKYELSWSGKQNAKQEAFKPLFGKTLKFFSGESKQPKTTRNLYIEGDSLEALKLLRNNYYGAIKLIYIDPPYNTGHDFIYNDSFKMTKDESDVAEGNMSELGERYTINRREHNRYHTNWLNMIYPRLKVAKELLKDDGVIFISIDDNEAANLKKVCDEIFGEDNFRADISWQKKYAVSNNFKGIASVRDCILVYSKTAQYRNGLFPRSEESITRYKNPDNDPRGVWKSVDYWNQASPEKRPNLVYPITNPNTGQTINPTKKAWKYSKETHEEHVKDNRIWWGKSGDNTVPALKRFLSEVREGLIPHNWWPHEFAGHTDAAKKEVEKLFDVATFDTPKPVSLIKRIIQVANLESDDVVLDFFGGSASTAHSVMEYNIKTGFCCKFIQVQIPEIVDKDSSAFKAGYQNICEIGKERIRRAGETILEQNKNKDDIENLDIGFKVFRVGDTNINWLHQDLKGSNLFDHYDQNATDKDRLDFTPGFTDLDVVYEIMLRQTDIPLSSKVEQLTDIGDRTYIFADSFLVCLEQTITEDLVDQLAALEPLPIKFIFRDSAFNDDIALKDETFRRLSALIDRNNAGDEQTYTVEFI